jgi:uracil-DNA glycosylase
MATRRLPVVASQLAAHKEQLSACTACRQMIGPVVAPPPVVSPVYLIGQAPGPHEGKFGRPFAWTAGKTLFRWFEGALGVGEEKFRESIYMAAVCRCFPGKASGGGDRVPSSDEIAACSRWMKAEIELLKPRLVVPVGRLAIEQVLGKAPLAELVGQAHRGRVLGFEADVIPLPHPSGASTWFKVEPGKSLTEKALALIGRHEAWKAAVG